MTDPTFKVELSTWRMLVDWTYACWLDVCALPRRGGGRVVFKSKIRFPNICKIKHEIKYENKFENKYETRFEFIFVFIFVFNFVFIFVFFRIFFVFVFVFILNFDTKINTKKNTKLIAEKDFEMTYFPNLDHCTKVNQLLNQKTLIWFSKLSFWEFSRKLKK